MVKKKAQADSFASRYFPSKVPVNLGFCCSALGTEVAPRAGDGHHPAVPARTEPSLFCNQADPGTAAPRLNRAQLTFTSASGAPDVSCQ